MGFPVVCSAHTTLARHAAEVGPCHGVLFGPLPPFRPESVVIDASAAFPRLRYGGGGEICRDQLELVGSSIN